VGVDSGYRYGGDEFGVILIDSDLAVAEEIGKRIREALNENGDLDASLGCAVYTEGMSAEDLISAADKRLYQMKSKSRLD